MKKKKAPRCPICRVEVGLRSENLNFPFCSPRCKRIDLGRWLGEEYTIPSAGEEGPPN